jgi:hypothetical protein
MVHTGSNEIQEKCMLQDETTGTDVFAAAAARKKAIAEQLGTRPLEEIIGVVDARGAGGWKEANGEWTLSFNFHCWKIPSGVLKNRPIAMSHTTSREQFDSLWEKVEAYSVLRVIARVVEESVIGTPQGQLVEFLSIDTSELELKKAALDLQKPVIHDDLEFGRFTLDRRVDWYAGETEWNGSTVTLTLPLDDSGKLDNALIHARLLWRDQEGWTQRVRDYAVQKLLPLKNQNWLDEGEDEMTTVQFKDRMTLESITMHPDGSFEFWHNDGDLFWGHSIQINGNLSEGLTDADIPG